VTRRGGLSDELEARITSLERRYALSPLATTKLRLLLEHLLNDPFAPTSIRDPGKVIDRHLADSLVGLELEPVRSASFALDLGSGAGFPGLPLAAALPEATFVLLDSAERRCAFVKRTATACGISNVLVIHARAESYERGLGRHDLVTARAVARLNVTAEYAAPLLRVGGTLVAWAGKRSTGDETAAKRAARELGFGELNVRHVQPFHGAQNHHLYLMSKVRATPARFPRRPGIARKRPLGLIAAGCGPSEHGGDSA
jgi:16S rRNA (guanine527-N7)-methyltransferase